MFHPCAPASEAVLLAEVREVGGDDGVPPDRAQARDVGPTVDLAAARGQTTQRSPSSPYASTARRSSSARESETVSTSVSTLSGVEPASRERRHSGAEYGVPLSSS